MARIIGHSPEALRVHQNLTTFVIDKSIVPLDLRMLATLQVAAVLEADYIIHNNLPRARKSGLSEEKIEAVLHGRPANFDAREQAVLNYARRVAQRAPLGETTIRDLRQFLSLQEISELVLLVATYHLVAAIVNPLEIEPDAHA